MTREKARQNMLLRNIDINYRETNFTYRLSPYIVTIQLFFT